MNPLPLPFLQRMAGILGPEAVDFQTSLDGEPPVSVRLHPEKPVPEPAGGRPVPWCGPGRYLPERPLFTADPFFHAGTYYVQEASSMILEAFMARLRDTDDAPRTILDLCAAPGGKATHLLSLMGSQDILVANEIHPQRFQVLRENLMRWGDPRILLGRSQAQALAKAHPARFDVILVDAPCSGEGMFRKDDHARRQWSEGLVQSCALRQRELIDEARTMLKPGGFLIYSTCTFSREENEDQIRRILASEGWTEIRPQLPEDTGIQASDHGVRCYPHRLNGEGLYMAMVRKPDERESFLSRSMFPARDGLIPSPEGRDLSYLLGEPDGSRFLKVGKDQTIVIPESLIRWNADLLGGPLSLQAGLPAGHWRTPDLFIPDQALACSPIRHPDLPAMDVDHETALRFLRKEPFDHPGQTRGIQLIRYGGHGLGWVKAVPGRINNLLPHHWRIRMEIPE